MKDYEELTGAYLQQVTSELDFFLRKRNSNRKAEELLEEFDDHQHGQISNTRLAAEARALLLQKYVDEAINYEVFQIGSLHADD